MSAQTNIATSRRMLEECFNEGALDVIDEICAPDVVEHDPALPQDIRGIEAMKEQVRMYRDAFPDLHFTIEDSLAARDEVVFRWSSTGMHEGELMGIEPTGRRGQVTGISINRIDATGRIAEIWNQWDNLGMLQQLGATDRATTQAPTG